MRERPWFPWATSEPDPAHSSYVEGWYRTFDGDAVIERLWHFPELGWTMHSAEAAKLEGWRFTGPLLPDVDEQADTYCLWEWPRVPGELAVLLPTGERFPWVLLAPVAYARRPSALEFVQDAWHTTYYDGRTLFGLRRWL